MQDASCDKGIKIRIFYQDGIYIYIPIRAIIYIYIYIYNTIFFLLDILSGKGNNLILVLGVNVEPKGDTNDDEMRIMGFSFLKLRLLVPTHVTNNLQQPYD